MWKIFTAVVMAVGLLVLSCDQVEEKPTMQKPLAQSEWLITGYLSSVSNEPNVSPIAYQLNFINDSTFILNLDINKLVGKYSATQDGTFQVIETKQTDSCCDSENALQLAAVISTTQNYRATQEGITLVGAGEVYLEEKKKENP